MNNNHENVIILLMGIAGTGKRTIGESIAKIDHSFRFVHHHSWIDPILNLLGKDSSVWWALDEKGWAKLNEARDVILSTISDVCPKSSSFVISLEMWDKDPYHKIFYEKVFEVVKKRKSLFLPVRLICNEENLITRVQRDDRKKYFKTTDVDLVRQRVKEKSVFYSGHQNEITIDVSNIPPTDAAAEIISKIHSLR